MIGKSVELAVEKAVKEIVDIRAHRYLQERLTTSKAYQEANRQYIEAFSKVENTLGGEHDRLVLRLEATTNALLTVIEEQAYRLGLEDGPKIKREFAKQGLVFSEEDETE